MVCRRAMHGVGICIEALVAQSLRYRLGRCVSIFRMRIIMAIAVGLFVQLGRKPAASVGGAAAGDSTVRVEDVARDYSKLTLVTPEPVLVSAQMAIFCRGVSQRDIAEAAKTSGPHAHTAVRIFMNDLASEAFRRGGAAYPVGAIVVKEKTGQRYFDEGSPRAVLKTHDGVGGMIKRERGYDAEHGDWEYFYFDDVAKVESGRIGSCVQCHAGAAKTDYVFGQWAKK